MLGQSLEYVGCQTRHVNGDAAVLIVDTTGHTAMSCESILVCDDTDMPVLVFFHVKEDYCEVFFKPEIWSGPNNGPWCWNIILCRECWDVQFATMCCLSMPSSAVIQLLGYSAQENDSLIRSDNHFITQAGIFLQWHIKRRRSSPTLPVHSYSGWHTGQTEVADLSSVGSHQYTFCAAWKPSSDVTSCQVP